MCHQSCTKLCFCNSYLWVEIEPTQCVDGRGVFCEVILHNALQAIQK